MFQINDMVMYGRSGVCQITDICKKQFSGMDEQLYYIMTPIFENNGTIFLPQSRVEGKLRTLISKEKALALIQTMPDTISIWIDDDRQRQEVYSEMVKKGEQEELIKLIITLYHKQEEKKANGKKIRATDEKIKADAEKLLYQEFAAVLEMDIDDVEAFIAKELNINNDTEIV